MCTGLFIQSEDGKYYQSRTMEFDNVFDLIPLLTDKIIGITPDGINFFDGINNHGLCCMAFYFKCSASYNANLVNDKINLASYEVCGYFLNNAKSVSDVIEIAKKINVTQQEYGPPFNIALPLHWFISDKKGNTIIVEPNNNGALTCYDNSKYKVCTNNPTHPEQVSNLETLINNNNFSYCNPPNQPNCGLGKGLIGMPGDSSSMSRFQRAYLLSQGMIIPGYKTNNINTMFHFSNNFDIVYGAVLDCTTNPPGIDFTQYTVVYDLTNLIAYYKTYDNQQITLLGSLKPADDNKNITELLYPKYSPYLQPMPSLGTSGRTSVAVLVGSSRGAGSSGRIYSYLKSTNQLENVTNSPQFKAIQERSQLALASIGGSNSKYNI
jgi:choloylglycine hydrolase